MNIECVELRDHPAEEKDRYFEHLLIEKLKYEKNGSFYIPFGFKVDIKENKKNLIREKWHYFMEVVFGKKKELLRECSPLFVKLVETFKNCSENACFFEPNSKEELMERFAWLDEMFQYFHLSDLERNVEKYHKGEPFTFDYFIVKHTFGVVFNEGLIDIHQDRTISCYPSNLKNGAVFFANLLIDSQFIYWTCARWGYIKECYKIEHSTLEGQCEIFVLILNFIGSFLFEKMDILNESIESYQLPPRSPLRDEILEIGKRDLIDKDLWLGVPFSLPKRRFQRILQIERWKYYKLNVNYPKFPLNTSNRYKITKQRKSKYHEKVKSINLENLRI